MSEIRNDTFAELARLRDENHRLQLQIAQLEAHAEDVEAACMQKQQQLSAFEASLTAVRAERPDPVAKMWQDYFIWTPASLAVINSAKDYITGLERQRAAWINARDVWTAETARIQSFATQQGECALNRLKRIEQLEAALKATPCSCGEYGWSDNDCKRCAALALPRPAKEQE